MDFDTSARSWNGNFNSQPAPYHDSHQHYNQVPAVPYYTNNSSALNHHHYYAPSVHHQPQTPLPPNHHHQGHRNLHHHQSHVPRAHAYYTQDMAAATAAHVQQRPYQPAQSPAPAPYSYLPHTSPPLPPHHQQSPAEHHISVLRDSPHPEYYTSAADLYNRVQTSQQSLSSPPSPGADSASSQGGAGANHYPSSSGVPRLPPILQVEKQQVTTSATQLASATRRKNEAHFVCPVPGCGSTFTRRFNLRGHLRSHTEERPYVCEWPGCKKGFARQHDCKRHQALHSAKSQNNLCRGCKKTFSRLDALNRHLRSEGGAECRQYHQRTAPSTSISTDDQRPADS